MRVVVDKWLLPLSVFLEHSNVGYQLLDVILKWSDNETTLIEMKITIIGQTF